MDQSVDMTDRSSRLRVPSLTEIDFESLRRGRLARLQKSLVTHDTPAALFFNQANIRYATGTDAEAVYSEGAHTRCCLVPAEGNPVLFEMSSAVHLSRKIMQDVRPITRLGAEQWASDIADALRDLSIAPDLRLAVDHISAARFLALQDRGINLVDSEAITCDAREVKTGEEIEIYKINGGIADAMLYAFEAAIRPGVREHELVATLGHALFMLQGEVLFARLVASGRNTNPWAYEGRDKLIMPGDLIIVDTDSNGFEGYVIDVSRTFLCGDDPTAAQRDAYRVAYDAVNALRQALRPGMSFEEVSRSVPRLPPRYREQRYPVMVHQAGLDESGPSIPYVEDVEEGLRTFPDRVIQPGMVLCLECYAGQVGGTCGVKLEDQVLVTENGCELLATYPFDAKLLGAAKEG